MVSISCSKLTKNFGTIPVLKDISFSINEGDKVGLIGNNGAGKTTLFKILINKLSYDSGDIFYNKNLTVGYLEQELKFSINDTLYEYCKSTFKEILAIAEKISKLEHTISEYGQKNLDPPKDVFETYSNLVDEFTLKEGYSYESKIKGVLRGIGFNDEDFFRNANELSGGQKSKLNLAKLLLSSPDILLLDEPTNHLDIESVTWLENFISKYKGTVILISHDRFFLNQVVTKIFELENKSLLEHEGSYSEFIRFKKELYITKLREFEKQDKDIKKQEEIIRRFKGHGTEKLAKRARSREKQLEKIELVEKPTIINEKTKLNLVSTTDSGYDVLKVKELSKSFGEKQIFNSVTFDVYKGDKIGIIGANGVGKTTLFKILTNSLTSSDGEISIGHNVTCGYYDQEQLNLNEKNNLIEEISDLKPMFSVTQIRTLLGSFLFKNDDVFKKISNLSGGEKGRISLLKLMLNNSNFLLLDEPTNHLDISSKEALESAILNYNATVLTISHDRYFLNKVCTKILELTNNGINLFLGNYDYYLEKKKEENNFQENPIVETKTKTQIKEERKREKEKLKEESKLKNKLKAIENDILITENLIKDLESELCDEKIFSNHELSYKLSKEVEDKRQHLNILYEEWESLV
ncbi:ribosomal protection-like ABC-F family protein [Helicovermis profundi]|uniref:ABC-F family ATP-binding cassette domain-containing protein n=1 Tax=Helicovermis profundi TaxID=3065157 RepID=A0AAU9E3W0_9FIRM|nr:ABC-F family ATP-binding cassette domain-containing protein [Clostridia bacterium S502]